MKIEDPGIKVCHPKKDIWKSACGENYKFRQIKNKVLNYEDG